MICEECLNSGYLQAISIGKCKVCGKPAYTPHLPSYVICKDCSTKYNLCEQCGTNLSEGEIAHNY